VRGSGAGYRDNEISVIRLSPKHSFVGVFASRKEGRKGIDQQYGCKSEGRRGRHTSIPSVPAGYSHRKNQTVLLHIRVENHLVEVQSSPPPLAVHQDGTERKPGRGEEELLEIGNCSLGRMKEVEENIRRTEAAVADIQARKTCVACYTGRPWRWFDREEAGGVTG
jgi:hypothetical protein